MISKPFITLPSDLDLDRLPQHVAVIMDGNGRWAQQRGLPRIAGHRQGANTLKELLRCCKDWGIKALTVYAFSTENWGRPLEEVSFLMMLFERLLQQQLAEMHREGVKINFIGDLSALPAPVRTAMETAIALTANNKTIEFTVAVNYGSRAEITKACQELAGQVQRGELQPGEITEDKIQQQLYAFSDPDLLIRTSGEKRLSNFLLWQLAYTEFYFTEVLWVDFDRAAFHQALLAYQKRDRRFGKVLVSA